MAQMPQASDTVPRYAIHVDPTDCDVLGHVNHARYLVFFERARWAVVREHFPDARLERGAQWAVVRHVDISYETEAVPGDDLVIRSGMERIGKTSFAVRQEARTLSGTLVCAAVVTLVTIGGGKPVPVPDSWRDLFPRWSEESL
jgi:YbgC/YbaW family acyl-CoA thioester hydrolase